MLNEIVTPGVLQPTPLKKNLVLRFEAKTRRGEMRLHFVDQGLHEDYTTSNTKPHGDLGIHGQEQPGTTKT